MATKKEVHPYRAVGRRKTAVARAYLAPGKGELVINGKTLEEYFPRLRHQAEVKKPFVLTQSLSRFRSKVTVQGGGATGQAEAVRHAFARVLEEMGEEFRTQLKKAGLLTRDSRTVERKKYGRAGARRRFQYSKR
jgi:small subunit ribosomal protein S9